MGRQFEKRLRAEIQLKSDNEARKLTIYERDEIVK